MKILMTADAVGGVWTYCLELAGVLQADGVSFALAVMGPPPDARQRQQASQLDNLTVYENPLALEWMDNPWREVDEAGEWLLALAQEFAPDLIHLNGYAHANLPWGAPTVVVAHSCVLSWWQSVKGGSAPARYDEYRRRVRAGLQSADVVIAPTAAMMAMLVRCHGLSRRVEVIPNGRELSAFRPARKQAFIATAGRLNDEAKNISVLRELAPQIPWPIQTAGEWQGEVNEKAAGVIHRGRLSEREMADFLGSAAIYAAPALYEPFGLAILEAALCGCALALGDIASLRENWDGAAVFVDSRDPEAWKSSLLRLIHDDSERARLSAAARDRASCFSAHSMAERYLAVYRGALAHRPGARDRDVPYCEFAR